jgi:hypothetical protein
MTEKHLVALYDDLAAKAWQRMADMIGVHAVTVLVQRAAWMTRQTHAEAQLIAISDGGVSFDGLSSADPAVVKAVAEEFIVSLVSILTRLLGTDMASRLAREIQDLSDRKEAAGRH